MNLIKKTALIVWAMAWLITQMVMDIAVTFLDVMRYALGEDGRPVSIIMFVFYMAASVVMVSFAAVTIAALRVI